MRALGAPPSPPAASSARASGSTRSTTPIALRSVSTLILGTRAPRNSFWGQVIFSIQSASWTVNEILGGPNRVRRRPARAREVLQPARRDAGGPRIRGRCYIAPHPALLCMGNRYAWQSSVGRNDRMPSSRPARTVARAAAPPVHGSATRCSSTPTPFGARAARCRGRAPCAWAAQRCSEGRLGGSALLLFVVFIG